MTEPKVTKPRKAPSKTSAKKTAATAPVAQTRSAMKATKGVAANPAKPEPRQAPGAKHVAATPKRRTKTAKFGVGMVVRHRVYPFRGVVFDIDPVFDNTEEWWLSIPEELRPKKNQPFYHLLAENDQTEYIAYVSEQNLLPDPSGAPLRHPKVAELFVKGPDGRYRAIYLQAH